ncbi:alpha/beta hydrolase fold domain-containing protein [Streptomyces sp. NPDC052127]|uniref:alpha/beta hydrolase fold domain-containing protein n=1 Tax=Streptomyces sp. NPDC052127 TaxID=3155679 RepID=UPI0034255300
MPILTRERGGPAIARQILLMPLLDDRTTTPDPHIEPYLLWSYDDSRTAWPALLGDAAGRPDAPATAAPARLEEATGLPPACIEVGQLDASRDEDLAHATKLSRAGVPVEFHLHPGVPHECAAQVRRDRGLLRARATGSWRCAARARLPG